MQTLIENEVSTFVEQNKEIVVNDNVDLVKATACIKGIKGLQAKVKESFDPIVDQAHKAHKEAISQRDKYLLPLQVMEKKFKDAILAFNKKMEEKQREFERIANERLAQVAEENKQKLLKEAAKTENEWDKEVLQEKAQEIVPITVDVQKKVIEQEGLTIRKTWKARVVDPLLIPREYLVVNQSLLNEVAKEYKGQLKVPGVEFYQEESASVRV